MSQQGRLWQSDGSRSLRDDVGREPLHVEDDRSDCQAMRHLCMTDPTGFRLDCAKTCRVYLRDNAYYSTLEADVNDERKEHVNVTDREVRPSMCIDATNKGYNGFFPMHTAEGGGNGDCDGQGKMEVPEISTTLQVIEDLRRYFHGSEVVNVIFNGPAIRSWSYCGRSLVHAQECSSWGERSSKGEAGLRKCKVIQVFGFLTIQNNKV